MADTARSNIKIIYQENGETVNRCEWYLPFSTNQLSIEIAQMVESLQ